MHCVHKNMVTCNIPTADHVVPSPRQSAERVEVNEDESLQASASTHKNGKVQSKKKKKKSKLTGCKQS